MVPPRGMASTALLRRFSRTCSIWSGSASTVGVGEALVDDPHVVHAPLVLADPQHAVEDAADLDRAALAALALAREQEDALDDLAAALAAGGDLLDLVADVGGQRTIEQHAAVADHAAQRVVDLVGDAGGEQADGGELLGALDLVLEGASAPQVEADEHGADDGPGVAGGAVAQESSLEVQRDRRLHGAGAGRAVGSTIATSPVKEPVRRRMLPQVVPAGAVQRGDVDAEAAAAGLGGGQAEELLAGPVPGDDAAVGVDGVEEDGGLIEDHRLVGGERLGLEHEQAVGQAERELGGERGEQAAGVRVDRLPGSRARRIRWPTVRAPNPRTTRSAARVGSTSPRSRRSEGSAGSRSTTGAPVDQVGGASSGSRGPKRGPWSARSCQRSQVLADAGEQGGAGEAEAGHDGGAGGGDGVLRAHEEASRRSTWAARRASNSRRRRSRRSRMRATVWAPSPRPAASESSTGIGSPSRRRRSSSPRQLPARA
jgi:hypothetical protein